MTIDEARKVRDGIKEETLKLIDRLRSSP